MENKKYKIEIKVVQVFTHYVEASNERVAKLIAQNQQDECRWTNVSFREVEGYKVEELENFPTNHQPFLDTIGEE